MDRLIQALLKSTEHAPLKTEYCDGAVAQMPPRPWPRLSMDRLIQALLKSTEHAPLKTEYCDGAVAQLGERLNGIQEVGGSIPLSSTIFSKLPLWPTNPPLSIEKSRLMGLDSVFVSKKALSSCSHRQSPVKNLLADHML